MIKITIDLDLEKQIQDEIDEQHREIKEDLVRSLKAATPEGEARDGWKIEDGNIVNDVEYIRYMNEGSSTIEGSRFIESTLLSHPSVKLSGTITRSK